MNLVAICGVAFVVVFSLLSLLALVMIGITKLFPPGEPKLDPKTAARLPRHPSKKTGSPPGPGSDPAIIAAVSAAVSALFPGAHVVHMEEDR